MPKLQNEIGVSKSSVYEWRQAYGIDAVHLMTSKSRQTPEDAEFRKLHDIIKQLEAEVTILKKEARCFTAK